MSQDRSEQLTRLSEMAVNGRIIHKIDLIGMVKICGEHYFNVYRRYNSVYEIVVEDNHGDFYTQKDMMFRDSIGAVLCLSRAKLRDMYTIELFSFRHGGTPNILSPSPELMYWSDIQRECYAIEINLRGVLEEFHTPLEDSEDDQDDQDDKDDQDDQDEYSDMPELVSEDEDEYADMPGLISDDEEDEYPQDQPKEEKEDLPESVICPYSDMPVFTGSSACFIPPFFCCKRTFMTYEDQVKSESEDNQEAEQRQEEDESEETYRGCGPDAFMILRNGTKYRKLR